MPCGRPGGMWCEFGSQSRACTRAAGTQTHSDDSASTLLSAVCALTMWKALKAPNSFCSHVLSGVSTASLVLVRSAWSLSCAQAGAVSGLLCASSARVG